MLPERLRHELGALHLDEGVVQARRKRPDALGGKLLRRKGEQVRGSFGPELVVLLDPPQSGCEDDGESQVGVAGRVRGAKLHPRRLEPPPLGDRHAHEGRAVVVCPRHVYRGLVASNEALVGVHPLIRHGRDLVRMAQQAGDELAGDLRQAVRVAGVGEGVLVALEEREVGVHAGALDAGKGFRHEGGMNASLLGDLLDDEAHGHHRVGHREGVGVAQVDLVLTRSVFVLGVFDANAHLLEGEHSPTTQLARDVVGRQVEVTAAIDGLGPAALGERRKIEVLDLRGDVEVVALIPRAIEYSAQLLARASVKGRPVNIDDVTKHPRDTGALFVPREQLERREVGSREYV